MQATLYLTASDPNKLNKVFDKALNVDILLKDNCDVLSPSIELAYFDTFAEYNYIYIPQLKRYYFLSRPVVNLGSAVTWACEVDPLMSYKDSINNLELIVDRSSYNNALLPDILKLQTNENILYRNFTGCEILQTIEGSNYSIVLTTL